MSDIKYIIKYKYLAYLIGNPMNAYYLAEFSNHPDIISLKLSEIYEKAHAYLFDNISDVITKFNKMHIRFQGTYDMDSCIIFRISLKNKLVENLGTVREIIFTDMPLLFDKANNLEKEINKLKSENEMLKTMIYYQPGGEGEKDSRSHFESLVKN